MVKKLNSLKNIMSFVLLALSVLSISSPAQAASAPDLGFTSNFAILGGTSVTSNGASTIFGDVGVSPGTSIVGFTPTANVVLHPGDAVAAQAQSDLTAAYNNVSAQAPTQTLTGELGGLTLTPGVYRFTTSATLTTGELTLDAQGNRDAVFIFQIGTTLTTSGNAGNGAIRFAGQTRSTNIFWQVGDSATLSSTAAFRGTIMALNSITMTSTINGPAAIDGRVLARNGAVTLNSNIASNIVEVPQIIRLVNLAGARVANGTDKFPMSVTVIEPAGPVAGEGVLLSSNRTQDIFDVPLATVTTNATGQALFNITSLLPGRAKITATTGKATVSNTDVVFVTAAPVLTTITVSPAAPSVVVGGTQQFTAATLDQFGNSFTAAVTWTSSNTSVGTINAAGMFTAVAPGTTTITAASGAVVSAPVTATVTAPVPVLTTITVSPATTTVVAGNTQQFTSSTLDQFGNTIAPIVTWNSSNASVGTINAAGMFTAVAAGTTTITAASGGITSAPATATVTVTAPVLTTITVSPATASLVVGNTTNFTAATLDQFGNPIVATVTWVSSNISVGTINPATGVFTAVAAGTTTVTAASGGVASAPVTATVTTAPPVLTTITVSPATASVVVGNTPNFVAATFDQFGSPIPAVVTWLSSNASVGTISPALGVFTAIAPGTTTITAASGGVVSAPVTVTVTATASVLTTITVSPPTISVFVGSVGSPVTAATLDQFGSPIAATVTWSSSNPGVGTIDPATGVFTAVAAGTTVVNATALGITGSSVVNVIAAVVNGTIAGRVTNASSGAAIVGASVSAGGMIGTTDAAGNYSISIAPGIYTVTANAAGFNTSSASLTVIAATTVIKNFGLLTPDVGVFDINGDGVIVKSEAVTAVLAFFSGTVPKATAVEVVIAFFRG